MQDNISTIEFPKNFTNITPECIDFYKNSQVSIELSHFQEFLDFIQIFVIITGIILNLLNIIVLLNSKLEESPYTYLTALALSDLFTLLTRIILPHIRKLVRFIDASLLSKFNLYVDIPINNVFISFSFYITLALTIERFIFVTAPFRAASICRKSKARRVCIFVALFSIGKTAYLPFMYKKSSCGKEIYEQHKSPLLDIFQFLIDLAIPYFTIFIINIVLMRSLKNKYVHGNSSIPIYIQKAKPLLVKSNSDFILQSKADNRNHTLQPTAIDVSSVKRAGIKFQFSNQLQDKDITYRRTFNEKEVKNQRKLTRSLIAILCCLLICHLPNVLLEESIIEALFGNHYESKVAFALRLIGWRISIILIYINCSANFAIYCISNKKFYNSSKILLKKWKDKLIDCYKKCCCVRPAKESNEFSMTSTSKRSQSNSQTSKWSFKASSFKNPIYKTPVNMYS